jgi:cytidine deaminase
MTERKNAQALIERALSAREKAYAPYSRFRVGAALLLKNGQTVVGANVENCSYGLSVCAERHAVAAAVMAGALPGDVIGVAVVADAATATPPCGACRQVLAEFATPDAFVVLYNLRDQHEVMLHMAELLPRAFDRESFSADAASRQSNAQAK